MLLRTLSNLVAAATLLRLAYGRSVPSQSTPLEGRQIQYCGLANESTFATTGDPVKGPGFWLTNDDLDPNVKYFLYENSRDTHPWKYVDIPIGDTVFIQVCPTFQGRVVRGTVPVNTDGLPHTLGTWLEMSWSDGVAWGDISFLEGSDGGAFLAATDGSGQARGCVADVLADAPPAALRANDAGLPVLDTVVDKPWRAGNAAARAWLDAVCDADQVFIQEPNHAIIASQDGRFDVAFIGGVAWGDCAADEGGGGGGGAWCRD
ncbi:hypothetical protein F4780DRAFT_775407 [Xylariomycetidae sp. FL0641]|nr:hypothetical protein F4780DRAFT_775407 [Xylariomycetidae sp. FL0641]